jgi:orotidine-5'-phosphate decarboxylase
MVLSPAALAAHPADRLIDAIVRCDAPVCVGLDPVMERMPAALGARTPAAAFEAFSVAVIGACAGHVPAVKLQSACFERFGADGVAALQASMDAARQRGLVTILDAKRGDIGISASHYAAAAVAMGADWITASGYMGPDTLMPFVDAGLGTFVLVRTSNGGSDALQSLRLADGRAVAEAVADMVEDLGATRCGTHGRSQLGAVVGATKPADGAALRARMPRTVMLVPGYGAQGGTLEDIRPLFGESGHDAVVTASRSVIYAFDAADRDWASSVARAAESFAREIREGIRE